MTGDTLLYNTIEEDQGAIDYVVEKFFPETRGGKGRGEIRRQNLLSIWSLPENNRIKLRPVYPQFLTEAGTFALPLSPVCFTIRGTVNRKIYDELLYANMVACDPPLDRNEIRTICNSVTRYKR